MSDTLTDSAEAFRELWEVLPGAIRYNGIVRPCIAQKVTHSRMPELASINVKAVSEITMLVSDFESFEGIKDRASALNFRETDRDWDDVSIDTGGDWGRDYVFVEDHTHPQSAVIHFFLAARNADD